MRPSKWSIPVQREFAATTPYFYGTYDTPEQGGENEAMEFIGKSGKETVMVFGSGPIRIGQGIEFDYASRSTACESLKSARL